MGPPAPPNTPLADYPVVVFRAPPPRDTDSLNAGVTLRWDEWDIVEANGVPQPMAFSKKKKGCSYEEFFLINNVQQNPKFTGLTPTTSFLHLVHKETRTVCVSRLLE